MNIIKSSFLIQFKNSFIPSQKHMPNRRYDLDWLRVLVFGLLIFYHIGMLYVENWGFHIKSQYQSQVLESFMLIIEPWRMPILWLISGIAMRFVLAKVSVYRFISIKSLRLLLPLLVGILVIIPPQLFIEMTYKGDLNLSYWQFLHAFYSNNSLVFSKYQSGIWPHIDVNHLWYLRSLWQFSLALVILLPLLNSRWVSRSLNWLFKQNAFIAIFISIMPVFIIQITITESKDLSRDALGFLFLIYGYLIGWEPLFWQKLKGTIKPLLIISTLCFTLFIGFYNLVYLNKDLDSEFLYASGMMVYSIFRILGALTVLALTYKFLNINSKKLSYFNDAVYPFYILHQTLIIVIGYYLSQQNLGPIIEPILIIFLTVAGCFIGYEVIRRVEFLRPCFGLNMTKKYNPKLVTFAYTACALSLIPLAIEILL